MTKLTGLSKTLIALIVVGAGGAAAYTHRDRFFDSKPSTATAKPAEVTPFPVPKRDAGELIVALSEWPGHMALVIANGGRTTQPGSPVAEMGAKLKIVFIEDAAKKNQALINGDVDFVWQTVDELPISMAAYRAAKVNAKAFGHQLAAHTERGRARPQGHQFLSRRLYPRPSFVRRGQSGRRMSVGAGRDLGPGQPPGCPPVVFHRGRHRAGR
jgi:hypothetical protein